MKKYFIILLVTLCAFCSLFSACVIGPDSAQRLYRLSENYTFGTLQLRVDNDIENERFVATHIKTAEKNYSTYFRVSFYAKQTGNAYINDSEFVITDNLGNDIDFDENGSYCFYDDRTFYISYANANEEIKAAIANNYYTISITGETFIPNT